MKKINPKIYKNSFRWQGVAAYPFFTSIWKEGARTQKKKYYTSWDKYASRFFGGQYTGYIPKKDFLKNGNKAIIDLLKGKRDFLNEVELIMEEIQKNVDNCKGRIAKNDFNDLEKWWSPAAEIQGKTICTIFNFDFALDVFLKKMQEKNKEEFDALNAAIAPDKPSFISVAQNRLLELEKQFPDDFDKVYNVFIKEYGWFQNSYKGIFTITKDWLKNYLLEVKKNLVVDKRVNLEITKINPKYALLIETARKFFSFRDEKKVILFLCVDLMEKWLRDSCKKIGLNFDDLRWLSFDEVQKALMGDENYIRLAKEYAKNNERICVLTPTSFEDIPKDDWSKIESFYVGKKESNLEVKGVIASNGLVRGRVKIVLDARKDFVKFKKGDVLVASMTRPEYSTLMMLASAFVTDEGGISCHAAIIARELGKPCIISTKNATKILKDGDLVEVDADNGIVKILNK